MLFCSYVIFLLRTKAGIQTCIAINKKEDDRRAIFKNAQQALGAVMQGKEETAGKMRKQALMDEILTPSPIKSGESSMKDSQKSGPKELDARIESYFL